MDNNRNTPSNNPNKDRNDKQNVQHDQQPEQREKLWWSEDEVAERGRIKPGKSDGERGED
jgi:hypothetical protein